jgi:hypothetical protein
MSQTAVQQQQQQLGVMASGMFLHWQSCNVPEPLRLPTVSPPNFSFTRHLRRCWMWGAVAQRALSFFLPPITPQKNLNGMLAGRCF